MGMFHTSLNTGLVPCRGMVSQGMLNGAGTGKDRETAVAALVILKKRFMIL